MPLRARVLAALAVAAVLMLATAAAAQAYFIEGSRWPSSTITYYTSAYNKAVDKAAKGWNNANVGVRFKRVSKRSKANFVVRYGRSVPPCEGVSLVGYQGRGVQSWIDLGRNCDSREFMVFTAIHEMGHILGLGHETHRCARMNSSADYPSGTPGECKYHDRSYWLSHLLKGDDTRGARAMYGG